MKYLTTILLLLICSNSSAIAVATPASLACTSKPEDKEERTAGLGSSGLSSSMVMDTKLYITNEIGASYKIDKDYDTYLVQDLERGVFTVATKKRGAYGETSIYAIPKTVKVKRKENIVQVKFDAILNTNFEATVKVNAATAQVQRFQWKYLAACIYNYSR
jgi:hypothetical protein